MFVSHKLPLIWVFCRRNLCEEERETCWLDLELSKVLKPNTEFFNTLVHKDTDQRSTPNSCILPLLLMTCKQICSDNIGNEITGGLASNIL